MEVFYLNDLVVPDGCRYCIRKPAAQVVRDSQLALNPQEFMYWVGGDMWHSADFCADFCSKRFPDRETALAAFMEATLCTR